MSRAPLHGPHGNPLVDVIVFFMNGKVDSLALLAHESQLFSFSPVEHVPVP